MNGEWEFRKGETRKALGISKFPHRKRVVLYLREGTVCRAAAYFTSEAEAEEVCELINHLVECKVVVHE